MRVDHAPSFRSVEHEQGRFRAHGEASLTVRGRVAHIVATGPFNLELIQAVGRVFRSAGSKLPADGRYIDLIEFRNSLLMPPEALRALGDLVERTAQKGFLAAHSVFVIGAEVEGRELMLQRVTQLWGRTRPISLHTDRAGGEQEAGRLAALLG